MSRAALRWSLSFALGAAALGTVVLLRPFPDQGRTFDAANAARPLDPAAPLVLVHIADLPPLGREGMMERFLEEMAQLRPSAVLIGGDIVYGETREAYGLMTGFLRRLEALGVRLVVGPGNHERKAWPEYLRHFGTGAPERVDIGRVRVLSLDSGHGRDQFTPSQFRWFRRELDHLEGQTPVVLLHHPLFRTNTSLRGEAGGSGGILHGHRQAFVDLCEARGVPIVLSGHWHCDGVFDAKGVIRTDGPDFPGTKFVVTTALGADLRPVVPGAKLDFGYRILVFEGGRLVRYTADTNGDGRPDPVASRVLGGGRP
jgi:predicted MPP superfamily phosphohydrolase